MKSIKKKNQNVCVADVAICHLILAYRMLACHTFFLRNAFRFSLLALGGLSCIWISCPARVCCCWCVKNVSKRSVLAVELFPSNMRISIFFFISFPCMLDVGRAQQCFFFVVNFVFFFFFELAHIYRSSVRYRCDDLLVMEIDVCGVCAVQ